MTIVRRLIRLWLAVAIGAGLTPLPPAGTGAMAQVQSTNTAPPACAALTAAHPVAAAGVTRGELRLDGTSRSQQKAFDLADAYAALALSPAGLRAPRHGAAACFAAASSFALRGPPRSV